MPLTRVDVTPVVVEDGAVRGDSAGEDEPGAARAQHVGLRVAGAGLRAAIGHQVHAERELVERRGLGGVADHEADRVHRRDGERVAAGVVLHEPDELLELVEGEVGADLFRGQLGHAPSKAGDDNLCNSTTTRCTI